MSNGDYLHVVGESTKLDRALVEWTEAINYVVESSVRQVVESYIPTLDDYLDQLDKGTFECLCLMEVVIKFHPDHTVTAIIPLNVLDGYSWAFQKKNIEVEVDGTFESVLS